MKKISRKLFLKKAAAGLAALAVSPALLSCDESDAGSRKIRKLAPLAGRYDVVIAGGGPAGFIAAIAAARQGAKTAIVERYGFFFKKMKNLAYLHDMGCVIQADTRCFLEGFREKMFAYKALKEGYIDVIASDCHNVTDRPPELAKAYAAIAKKAGEEAVELLKQNAAALLPHTL